MRLRMLSLKEMRLFLRSSQSIKLKFQSIGIITILVVFGVLTTNNSFDIFSYNADVLIKILMFLMLLIGIFYLLFIDTNNFKIGTIGLGITSNLNSINTLTQLDDKIITIEEEKIRYEKRKNEKLEFKSLSEIESILNDEDILAFSSIDKIKILIKGKILEHKIPLISQNEKNIFVYTPIFDFFDNIINGGINALYGKSRRIFLNFILKNFSKNGEAFGYENLRKRYTEWLSIKKSNSDNYLTMDQTYILSEFL